MKLKDNIIYIKPLEDSKSLEDMCLWNCETFKDLYLLWASLLGLCTYPLYSCESVLFLPTPEMRSNHGICQ